MSSSLLAALKAFDVTARLGSMTAAARCLHLQQPTISAHVQRLEQQFGVELFYRRGRRLELTPFGRSLVECTRRTFSAEEDAMALLAAARQQFIGRLSVHAIGPYNVVPVLRSFAAQHPKVTLVVGVGDSRTITHKIVDYQGDVGIVLNHAPHADLFCMPYRRQSLVVFAHRAHPLAGRDPIAMRDLAGQRFVIREEGSTTRRVFERELAAHGVRIQVAVEMGSREAVREAVAEGMGLGVVAQTAYIPDTRLVPLQVADSNMATQVDIICRAERRHAPLVAAFFAAAERTAPHEGTAAAPALP